VDPVTRDERAEPRRAWSALQDFLVEVYERKAACAGEVPDGRVELQVELVGEGVVARRDRAEDCHDVLRFGLVADARLDHGN
jgi:hypothetical protein